MDRSRNSIVDEEESRVYPLQFIHRDDLRDIPAPLARITTCGMLQVEVLKEVVSTDPPLGRYMVISTQVLRGRGAVSSLMLLKLLASRSHRFATCDWLSTHMKQELLKGTDMRLDTPASYLRGVLCKIEDVPERVDAFRLLVVEYLRNGRSSGPGYQLGAYPLLWLDTEALSYQIERGTLMESMSEFALARPFWQRAYQLAFKGEYLPDEPHSDWAQSTREQVAGHLRQSVHALRRLLLTQRGEAAKEEVILLLLSYWLSHKADEDALRPLMELLGEQERFGEAEEYYQQCAAALEQMEAGRQPAKQTRDLHEFQRIKHLNRTPTQVSPVSLQEVRLKEPDLSVSSLASMVQLPYTQIAAWSEMVISGQEVSVSSEYRTLLPPALSMQISSLETASLDIATWLGARVNDLKALGVFWHESTITCQQQQAFIQAEFNKWSKMTHQDAQPTNEYLISRRMALATLATLSSSLVAKVQFGPLTTFVIGEFLAQCATSITTCWHLMQGRELTIVQQALTRYLPVLSSWARQSSSYQQTSAYLAAQGCLLMGLLSLHSLPTPQNFQKRTLYCTEATEYAHLSADPCLQITALTHLANARYDMGQLDKMLQTYQKAVSTLDDLSKQHQFPMLLRSKLQVGLAHAYAQQGHVQNSLRALEEARALFPNEYEVAPVFLSTDYGRYSLIQFEGRTHLDLEKHAPGDHHSRQAANALAKIEAVSISEQIPERFRVEIINQQTLAAIREGNLDNFRRYLFEGAKGAKALESEKRRQEAIANWKAARERWPQEKSVLELADALF
jgi:tetratricopeptide (TPR) repeat protein